MTLMLAAATAAPPDPSGATLPATSQAAPGPSALEQYEERYIWAEDFPVVYGDRHHVATTIGTFFYQGKYRKPLAGADLYDAIDRPDLAATYRQRATGKYLLCGAGLALIVGGGAYAIANFSSAPPDLNLPPAQFAQQAQAASDAAREAALIGIAISSGGVVLLMVGALLDVDPLNASEARRLVDEYDQRLKGELGLTAADPEKGSTSSDRPSFSFGVAPGNGGAMASLAIAF
jgi:hypothetical protein